MAGSDRICFYAEAPLGKLAKWLRIIGFDTLYESGKFQQKSVDLKRGKRIVLTRTVKGRKIKPPGKIIFIKANDPGEQLKEIVRKLGMVPEDMRPFSRCIRCNVPIRSADKIFVRGKVPDHVWETNDVFYTCSLCRRIYWPGTHTVRTKEMIQRLFIF